MRNRPITVSESVRQGEKLSPSSALDHYGPGHDVVNSPVVLEEEECDENGKEKSDGEVLVQRPHSGG